MQTVRVFLCSSHGDMVADRRVLHAEVVPAVCRLLEPRGVVVELVDPWERIARGPPPSDAGLLAENLAAMDSCRPFILVLLGHAYGCPLDPLPEALTARYPALKDRPGQSLEHLEIGYALGSNGPPRGTIAMLRAESALDELPDQFRNRYRDPAGITRANELRGAVLASGCPAVEYDAHWNAGANELQPGAMFAQRLTVLLLQTIEAELPPSVEVGPPSAELSRKAAVAAPLLDENVQFTVYRPKAVQPAVWYPLLAFAHLSEKPPDAPDDAPDPVEEVRQQAERILGPQVKEFKQTTQDSLAAVPRSGELTMVPEVPGIEFNPPRRSFLWTEPVHREEFRLRASEQADGTTLRGRMTVFLGAIVLADVPLAIQVNRTARQPAVAETAPAAARPYRKIFASYSHLDMQVVEELERYGRMLGDEYLRDVNHLRSGQQWNNELLRMIEEADVFQLFWSKNSMLSPYVRQEWEHALRLNRPSFVRPTYWESPFPNVPEQNLPPPELSELHFQQIQVLAPTASRPAAPDAPSHITRSRDLPAATPIVPAAEPPPARGPETSRKSAPATLRKLTVAFGMMLVVTMVGGVWITGQRMTSAPPDAGEPPSSRGGFPRDGVLILALRDADQLTPQQKDEIALLAELVAAPAEITLVLPVERGQQSRFEQVGLEIRERLPESSILSSPPVYVAEFTVPRAVPADYRIAAVSDDHSPLALGIDGVSPLDNSLVFQNGGMAVNVRRADTGPIQGFIVSRKPGVSVSLVLLRAVSDPASQSPSTRP